MAAPRREAFPRGRRVRKRRDYLQIQNQGRRASGAHYMLFALPQAADAAAPEGAARPRGPRFGITVSKKVGNAVTRNQVKRWVRESCRRMGAAAPEGVDLVVVARPQAAGVGFAPTARELASLATQLSSRPHPRPTR